MKKFMTLVHIITIIVLIVDWGVMGVKILDNNYDIMVEAYIGLACILIIFMCALYKIFRNKCPYCSKMQLTNGKYCSFCGKNIGD